MREEPCREIYTCKKLIEGIARKEISEDDREFIYAQICEEFPILCEDSLRRKY